jgi:hypothetical protein
MKILIHKHEFSEKLIDVSIIAQHLLKRGLKMKFLKALNSSINLYSTPIDENERREMKFLQFKVSDSKAVSPFNESFRVPLQQ